ncbi:MAG: hypothetical protein CNE91_06930 [SAR116 cluster bacterium MED-G04]|jgi:hypothetical protein|nr:hypothetical protein [SAR116 cluster bacterium]PDH62704.1 MAG: hypothetical protein CNE91_06930 [SAR116 cluster bacterium MED-G04]|tara:strand:+ start:1017 stop:1412 length:396 start_codon:yes stop_codon:yes gene_type:complete
MFIEILIVILILAGFFVLHLEGKDRKQQQDRMIEFLEEQHHLISRLRHEMQESMEKMRKANADDSTVLTKEINEISRELLRLSDEIRGDSLMSKAIDMARSGSDVDGVVEATGITREEALALVAFHGPKRG